jgi:hypothetical protein
MAEFDKRDATGEAIHEALRAVICVPKESYLWTPAHMVSFTPALASTVYGDGRALIGLTTINSRPRYYVIRIDGSIEIGSDMTAPDDTPEIWDLLDEIKDDLEDEFGIGRPDDEANLGIDGRWRHYQTGKFVFDPQPWPAFDDRDGCSWWREKWPALTGVPTTPHPYSRHYNLLATYTKVDAT